VPIQADETPRTHTADDSREPFMKVAIWVFNILAFLAFIAFAGLMLLGGYHGSTENETMVKIRSDPFKVMYSLTEPEELKLWIGGLTNVQMLSEDLAHVGSTARMTVEQDETRTVMDAKITEYEPEERIVIAYSNDKFEGRGTYLLDYRPPRTHVIYTLEIQYKTFWDKLLSPIVEGKTQEKIEHDLNELRYRVEHTP